MRVALLCNKSKKSRGVAHDGEQSDASNSNAILGEGGGREGAGGGEGGGGGG